MMGVEESFNQKVLDLSGKAPNLEKNIENIKKTEELGIKVHLTYCFGMIGDTKATVEDTIKKSLELRADSRQYSIAMPFLGSNLWKEYNEKGILVTYDLNKYDVNHEAMANLEDLSAKDLMRLKDEAERMNKQQIVNMVSSQFRTTKFSNRLKAAIHGLDKLLVTGTCRRAVVRRLAEIVAEVAKCIAEMVVMVYGHARLEVF